MIHHSYPTQEDQPELHVTSLGEVVTLPHPECWLCKQCACLQRMVQGVVVHGKRASAGERLRCIAAIQRRIESMEKLIKHANSFVGISGPAWTVTILRGLLREIKGDK